MFFQCTSHHPGILHTAQAVLQVKCLSGPPDMISQIHSFTATRYAVDLHITGHHTHLIAHDKSLVRRFTHLKNLSSDIVIVDASEYFDCFRLYPSLLMPLISQKAIFVHTFLSRISLFGKCCVRTETLKVFVAPQRWTLLLKSSGRSVFFFSQARRTSNCKVQKGKIISVFTFDCVGISTITRHGIVFIKDGLFNGSDNVMHMQQYIQYKAKTFGNILPRNLALYHLYKNEDIIMP